MNTRNPGQEVPQGAGDDKARIGLLPAAPFDINSIRPRAAVLVLLWGEPVRVLVERKACSGSWKWGCDIALPGGTIEDGENPIEAALREAWEEAWVHPAMVEILGSLPVTRTRLGNITILPILAKPRGPICPMPRDREVDQVFWLRLDIIHEKPQTILHPKRGIRVKGYLLPGGGVLWGATLRILRLLWREKLGLNP